MYTADVTIAVLCDWTVGVSGDEERRQHSVVQTEGSGGGVTDI